jgi:hypothetical protein
LKRKELFIRSLNRRRRQRWWWQQIIMNNGVNEKTDKIFCIFFHWKSSCNLILFIEINISIINDLLFFR